MSRRRPAHFTEPQPPAFDEWDAKGVAEAAAGTIARGESISLEPGQGRVLWNVRAGDRNLGTVERMDLDAPVWASPAFGIELAIGDMASEPPAARGKHTYIEVPKGSHKVAGARYRAVPTMPAAEFD